MNLIAELARLKALDEKYREVGGMLYTGEQLTDAGRSVFETYADLFSALSASVALNVELVKASRKYVAWEKLDEQQQAVLEQAEALGIKA